MSKIKWIEPNDNNDINYNDDLIVINIKFYLIDVIKNKKLSNELSSYFNINHESPQLMVVNNGKLVHNSSHSNISFKNIKK